MVETSPMSHVVTIPTFSLHHHHHAQLPLPLSSTLATAHMWANLGRGRRCHVTPAMTPTTTPTMHLDPAMTPKLHPSSTPCHPDDDPDDAPQSCHVSRQLHPSTTPRHPDNIPNDATSRHRPSSATTATSLPNGNSRRWGRWGRMDRGGECEGRGERTTTTWSSSSPGSFVDTRGDGGQGTTTGYVIVPWSS